MGMLALRNQGALSPWRAVRELEEEFDRLFPDFSRRIGWAEHAWLPAVDLKETEDHYELDADLPGITKDDIEVIVQDNLVTLKGERKGEREKKEDGYHLYERQFGAFQRSFTIPEGVDEAKVQASFKDGVLRVILPKHERAKAKRIEVKSN